MPEALLRAELAAVTTSLEALLLAAVGLGGLFWSELCHQKVRGVCRELVWNLHAWRDCVGHA